MTAMVWDVKSGRLTRRPLRGNTCRIVFVASSLDGSRVVSVSLGGDVCVWDANTGVLAFGPSLRHAESALVVAFKPGCTFHAVSPDGKWITGYKGGDCKTVQVRDVKTGLLLAALKSHTDDVVSVTFSPDSKWILSTSFDKTVRVHTINWGVGHVHVDESHVKHNAMIPSF